MSQVRIRHLKNPEDPKGPGIITIEVNRKPVQLPAKGYDKVIQVRNVDFQIREEQGRENQ